MKVVAKTAARQQLLGVGRRPRSGEHFYTWIRTSSVSIFPRCAYISSHHCTLPYQVYAKYFLRPRMQRSCALSHQQVRDGLVLEEAETISNYHAHAKLSRGSASPSPTAGSSMAQAAAGGSSGKQQQQQRGGKGSEDVCDGADPTSSDEEANISRRTRSGSVCKRVGYFRA